MIKKVLKGLGIVAAGGLVIGVFWYFQSLKIDGEPLLTACWAVDIFDDITGEKVVGAEDLDFDPVTGTIFVSAYDRRAVAREIDEGNVTTQGGIYTFQVSDITESSTLNVTDISRKIKESIDFLPHGFFISNDTEGNKIYVINRRYIKQGQSMIAHPFIEHMHISEGFLKANGSLMNPAVCHANDLTKFGEDILVTNDRANCKVGYGDEGNGSVQLLKGDSIREVLSYLPFPNGIAILQGDRTMIAIALTRGNSIYIINDIGGERPKKIELNGAPDNLTVDQTQNLFVTIFPSLVDYFFYMKGWFGVKKSPSAAYRISPDDYAQELLFKDDGSMISGATVALRAGDYLILGSGWDDNIAICSGMEALN